MAQRVSAPRRASQQLVDVHPSRGALVDRVARNFTRQHVPKAERLEALSIELPLTPFEADAGTVVTLDLPVFERCAACGGTGHAAVLQCGACAGQGFREGEETVRLHVPRGVRDGDAIAIALSPIGIHNFFLAVHVRVTENLA